MKSVLVSFLDRNKVVKCPIETDNGDIPYLKKGFRKHFSFEKHIAVDITFQHFDEEWQEYIDLNVDEVIQHKEKLKVVVTSTLHTPAPTDDNVSM